VPSKEHDATSFQPHTDLALKLYTFKISNAALRTTHMLRGLHYAYVTPMQIA